MKRLVMLMFVVALCPQLASAQGAISASAAADVNDDGAVNVSDVQLAINAALGSAVVSKASPDAALTGTEVAILGNNFSMSPASNTIDFGGGVTAAASAVELVRGQRAILRVTVPKGLAAGPVMLTVTSNGVAASGSATLEVLTGPRVSTVAGTGVQGFGGDGGPAIAATLNRPEDVAVTAATIYVADTSSNRVRAIDRGTGLISTFAGTGAGSHSGDGGQASQAGLFNPQAVAVDSAGNVFVSATGDSRVRRIDAVTGVIQTVAGTGAFAFNGESGQGDQVALNFPRGLAVDLQGNLLICDTNNSRIRRLNTSTGMIETIAGSGPGGGMSAGFSGDGGQATSALLQNPAGVCVDGQGNIYVADRGNHRIRMINASTGVITTVAGTGVAGFTSAAGPALSADLNAPGGVSLLAPGQLLISESSNHVLRLLDLGTGTLSLFMGDGMPGDSGDGGLAQDARLRGPGRMAVSSSGEVFIAEQDGARVRLVSP